MPLCWWGGFFVGPLLAAAVYSSSERGTLRRSHGGAAALMWSAVLAVWVPFSLWVLLLGGAEPELLLVAVPFFLVATVGASTYGTVQAIRHMTVSGRPPTGPSDDVEPDGDAYPILADGVRRVVRARGFLVWMLRVDVVFVGVWLSTTGPGPVALAGLWTCVCGWLLWTMRPGVTATPEGLRIKGLTGSRWIPRDRVRGLTVDRENVLWYRTIDLQVLVKGEQPIRVPWVSWNTGFEAFITGPPATLPRLNQQRVINNLLAALKLPA